MLHRSAPSPTRATRRRLALLLALSSLLAGCAPDPTEPLVLAETRVFVSRMQVAAGHVALVEGVETSSNPSEAGVAVRVLDLDGNETLRAAVSRGARGLALSEDAVATLELTSTLANQHLVVRPLAGGAPVLVPHRWPPIALAARDGVFFFVEARLVGVVDDDGDEVADANEIGLELVEVDATGLVRRRTEVDLPTGIRGPAAALVPFPRVFGLVATDEVAYLGWGSLLCGGGSEVLAIELATGATTIAWRGAAATFEGTSCTCASGVDNVTELGETLIVVDGAITVAGSVFACASVVAERGFVARGATTRRLDDPIVAGTSGERGVLVASQRAVYELGAEPTPRATPPRGEPVSAVAWDEGSARRALVATSRAVYRLEL